MVKARRQAGISQIGTKIHINYKLQWLGWRKCAQCWDVCLSLLPWAFHLGKNGGAVSEWRAFPVLSFRRSYSECVEPSRLRERLWWQGCLSWKLLCLLLRKLTSQGRAQLVHTDAGGACFCPYLPDHRMAEHHGRTWTQFKRSGAFQIRRGAQVITASLGTAFGFHPAFHHLS